MDQSKNQETLDRISAGLEWLLKHHKTEGFSNSKDVLANQFGEDVAETILARWQQYEAAERTIFSAAKNGQSVAVHTTSSSNQEQVDQSLADTKSYIQSTRSFSDNIATEANRRTPNDLPAKLGKFTLIELLGRGAFGAVFLAEDADLQRQVAIKIPHLDRIGDATSGTLFSRSTSCRKSKP